MVKATTIKEQVKIPKGVTITVDGNIIIVNGEKGELRKTFSHPKINIKLNSDKLEINGKDVRRKELALIGTIKAHTKNMIKGVTEGFEYKMKTVFSHFPIKTAVEENEFIIQNFLGERSARRAKILEGVNIEIKGDDITVQGIDKEKVGQTVANIEKATAVKRRDTRVFQDGVYRISKGGR
jgi:large subunit ribosomal protein L6